MIRKHLFIENVKRKIIYGDYGVLIQIFNNDHKFSIYFGDIIAYCRKFILELQNKILIGNLLENNVLRIA